MRKKAEKEEEVVEERWQSGRGAGEERDGRIEESEGIGGEVGEVCKRMSGEGEWVREQRKRRLREGI